MTKITASLFAHIENDANLSGVYNLEGQKFINTISYLQQYLDQLQSKREVPPAYVNLISDTNYLKTVESKRAEIIQSGSLDEDIVNLADTITNDILTLDIGERLLLPGGWLNFDGGHGMVYQITRTEHGFRFTVFNAGAGIEYHHKKSSIEKELYNPTKTWEFPFPKTPHEKKELSFFIGRLLKARLPTATRKAFDEKILYEETLASISHIGGYEVVPEKIPDFGYTSGQLSGTCAQRCIHQMLKLNSSSAKVYERFIFKFKHYALLDYVKACFDTKEEPLTPAVINQIRFAIENNLKILNISNLFDAEKTQHYFTELSQIKEKINNHKFTKPVKKITEYDPLPLLIVRGNQDTAKPPYLYTPSYYEKPPLPVHLGTGKNLLINLDKIINQIAHLEPATQYYYLEQVLTSLPTNVETNRFYAELNNLSQYQRFSNQLDSLQKILLQLQDNWLKGSRIPSLQVMQLQLLNMQVKVHEKINQEDKLPSFNLFDATMLNTILGNNLRNPFYATNQPVLDKNFKALQKQYRSAAFNKHRVFYDYLKKLLATEPDLNNQLKKLYNEKYSANATQLHTKIRKHGLEALYLISQHLKREELLSTSTLPGETNFSPIISKIVNHLAYESKLRRAINPFFAKELSYHQRLDFVMEKGKFFLYTPLYPTFLTWQELSTKLSEHKYPLSDSPAKDALRADIPNKSEYNDKITPLSANEIQLTPGNPAKDANRPVTQSDILARDYLHLRSKPRFQIALTLDYFIRHIDKLSLIENQRYVEANIFQPGLLLDALKEKAFLPQFDKFLKTGYRFFNKEGQFTSDSVLFLRLDFLVSRYLYHIDPQKGLARLKALQETLLNQLSVENTPDVTYVLQQYLFQTIMTRIDLDKDSGELFEQAFKAYAYIQSHANPFILEDTAHRVDVDSNIAKFQILISHQSINQVTPVVKNFLLPESEQENWEIAADSFPMYRLTHKLNGKTLRFNILQGKRFENGLAHSGLPLELQKHPLIKHLNLQDKHECLVDPEGTYLRLPEDKVELFYKNNNLIVQKQWSVGGAFREYELQPLSQHHLAQHANKKTAPINVSLPHVLTDGTMDYWHETNDSNHGLLVHNNKPVYSISKGVLTVLDEQGKETNYKLDTLPANYRPLLNNFESNKFILTYSSLTDTIVKLPRYNLTFELHPSDPQLVYTETKERVIDCPSPIHPAVAGLVLEKNSHTRYLVPVGRFFATEKEAKQGEFYPVIHDIYGTIAESALQQEWNKKPPIQKPLWHYQNSERTLSFRLQNGEPVADTVADALYLAYIYLATNQVEKAWAVLQDCNTRLGGLTGDPAELQFISWIFEDLPHRLSDNHREAARQTPPYVACQLKAMSLACDFLLQDRKFDLKEPTIDDTANSQCAQLQYQQVKSFLDNLPAKIYDSFSRLQRVRRHLEHDYDLSTLERKRLLDYYQQSQPKKASPKGALGYEWMLLNLETLKQERDTLLSRQQSNPLSLDDNKRLAFIEKHLKKIKPPLAKSSHLQLVAIDLTLNRDSRINEARLPQKTKRIFDSWQNMLSFKDETDVLKLSSAFDALNSAISEHDFICHFPVYLKIAATNQDPTLFKRLLDFCTATLIANRHILLEKQESSIPLLCNILYRTCNNRSNLVLDLDNFKLADLIRGVSSFSCPPLKVYEPKDIYQHVLAKPEDILKRERPQTIPLTPPMLETTTLFDLLNSLAKQTIGNNRGLNELSNQLDSVITQYRELQAETAQHLQETATEDAAGKLLLQSEQQQKELAQQFTDNPLLAKLVLDRVDSIVVSIDKVREKAWKKALFLANLGPDTPQQRIAWEISKQAKEKPTLNKKELLSIYCRADLNYTVELTGLNSTKAKELYELIHNALVKGIQSQLFKQVKSKLSSATKTGNIDAALEALDTLAREEIPALASPATVIIQHEQDILLRKRQVTALQSLLEPAPDGRGFKNVIEKIIPGGGKSKVIIPVVAEMKAQGDNLVIIEVPPALLATNYIDANRTSQRLFGKRAHRFEFDRNSTVSPKRLEQIYRQFVEVMTTKSYLITTGDSLRSLEAKYIELLSVKERDKTWHKQVYWLDKIVNLLHHNADNLIDEVHKGLWLKSILNYTLGESHPLESTLIRNAVALYGFIDDKLIKTAHTLPQNYDWAPFQTDLATKLVNDPTSPLTSFINKAVRVYGTDVKKELINYLSNKATELSPVILEATAEEKATLAFFKQEITVLLPATLQGSNTVSKHNVTYGRSRLENLSPLQYTLAIPYIGNRLANERSRFGNELEAVNYTMQMMLTKGIGKKLFKELIATWLAAARQELFQNPGLKHLDATPTGKGFALLEKDTGLKLSQVQLNNPQQIAALLARHKHNRSLIATLLQERVLRQINQDGTILSIDAYNHVDICRSTQGVSGTPSNYTTYHQRLHYNPKSSFGSDAYTVELLRSKDSKISYFDYENTAQFIEKTLTNSEAHERIRAIIDINATFTGVTNLNVATEIVSFINKHPDHFSLPIKHVLYFNEEQVLCALDVTKPEKPIVLGTSEEKEISLLLGSKPEERFTFYDQVHTLGTDIRQYLEAHALVLADEKIPFQAWKQGNDRMRGLSQSQTLEFILPKRLQDLTYDEWIQRMQDNDKSVLALDNLSAAKGQMRNLLRRRCLSLIQDLPSEEAGRKAELTEHFAPFFIDTPSRDFFALYGAISKKEKVTVIFENFKQQLLETWKTCHAKAKIELSATELEQIEQRLQEIIKSAIPNGLAEYEDTANSLSKEVQIQKQVQKQVQTQHTLDGCFNPHLKSKETYDWYNLRFNFTYYLNQLTLPLNTFCANSATPELFSQNLRASKNYVETYQGQQKYADAFLKPVFLVWYHLKNEKLQATIVTSQDAENLQDIVKDSPGSWIATTEDTVVAGEAPEAICANSDYQRLREQVRFFNGECSSLLNQGTPLLWLNEQPANKIAFFERYLLPYRPGNEAELEQLKTVLLKGNIEGFAYIANHPFEDLTQQDWKTLFPDTIPVQIAEYQKMAEAFAYVNSNIWVQTLTMVELQEKFNLPLNSLSFLDNHLQPLLRLKQRLEQPLLLFLKNLSKEEKHYLELCLEMSLSKFYDLQGLNNPEEAQPEEMALATIEALFKLKNYPAFKITQEMSIDIVLITFAQQTTSKKILNTLLENRPSQALIKTILQNSCCDDTIVKSLLDSHRTFSEETLNLLAEKCHSEEFATKLYQKEGLPEKALRILLKNGKLNTAQLFSVLDETSNFKIISLVYSHPAAGDSIQQAALKHPDLSPRLVCNLLTKKPFPSDTVILQFLTDSTLITNATLEILIKEIKNPEVIVKIMTHRAATPALNNLVLEQHELSLAIAKIILKGKTDKKILENLFFKILDRYQNSQVISEKEEWENCLADILGKTPDLHPIRAIEALKQTKISARLGFSFLYCFGRNLIAILPFQEMAATDNVESLKLLFAQRNTGELSEEKLLMLAKRCETIQLSELLLKRSDITDSVLQELLTSAPLTASLLALIIEKASSPDMLERVYAHSAASTKNKESIFASPLLNTELFKSFLEQNRVGNGEVTLALKNPACHITPDLLKRMAEMAFSSDVLAGIVAYAKGNQEVMSAVIDNENFSFNTAQWILYRLDDVATPQELIKKLTLKAFKHLQSEQEQQKWEPVLLRLLIRSSYMPGLTDEIVKIINEQTEIKSSTIGVTILRRFGSRVTVKLPLDAMVNSISDTDEITTLITPGTIKEFTEEQLLILVPKCTTQTLRELLFKRKELTEKTLQAIIAHHIGNMPFSQIILILKLAKTPETLRPILNKYRGHDDIRKLLLQHEALSADLMLSILKAIPRNELELALSHPTAVTADVLQAMTQCNVSSALLLKICMHRNADSAVKTMVLKQPNLSPEIAQYIIDSCGIDIEQHHGLLKILLTNMFERYKRENKVAWEQCLIKLVEKYERGTDAAGDMITIIKQQQNLTPTLGLKILQQFGKDVASALPIRQMIQIADAKEIDLLVDSEKTGPLSEENLLLLVDKCKKPEHFAHILKKNNLTEHVLYAILNKIPDYDNLHLTLSHPRLSERSRRQWLETLNRQYDELASVQDPEKKLLLSLEKLKIKSCQHAVKALKDSNYESAAKTAVTLYHALNQEMENYFSSPTPSTAQDFQLNCIKAINDAKGVLEVHRGYKQILVDIVNAILAAVTLNLKSVFSNNWRFFQAKTASVEIVDEISKTLIPQNA
ncbi:DUF3638 domain-containing protein [Legionella jamestowniensis]|uniref:Ninein n=1 Tax=Legionella jamestowniensis TaxID=455 RepID=A0A0W0UIR3_9GAMM|nr:DUF3638 domain-containing protein [Legionella jamestowniensis]KTD07607.1 ninein [Legionella jamestowniensis]SFL59362.1 Protein of unknown function [Legionella jamestowniensis DSM 19215]